MSASSHTAHDEGHGSFRSYMIGFILSVILTVIPFYLVMGDVLDNRLLAIAIIFALGAVQMIVHIYYFLHVTSKAENGWTAMSLIFTVVLVGIVLSGSIWVMFHLEENMMPSHDRVEQFRSLTD
ncbi:MAG: cytochrome o ubiquinol oxidase subunit IV [Rhodobacteraceae bacterium]|nr:cytochrome o ubiquinol oxidase subunit IV [Paracoccaceae bacterium]